MADRILFHHRATLMKSPFPGMDPYLEAHWGDIHQSLLIYARDQLPKIGVPLREHERDVTLDLQALIDQCYAGGAYDDIDYRSDPKPPFRNSDTGWADQLLRTSGHRTESNR